MDGISECQKCLFNVVHVTITTNFLPVLVYVREASRLLAIIFIELANYRLCKASTESGTNTQVTVKACSPLVLWGWYIFYVKSVSTKAASFMPCSLQSKQVYYCFFFIIYIILKIYLIYRKMFYLLINFLLNVNFKKINCLSR